MNAHQLHAKADRLARRLGITYAAACAALGRRGGARRRSTRRVVETKPLDLKNYWWNRDDL